MNNKDNLYRMKEFQKLKGWYMEQVTHNLFTFAKGGKKRCLHIDDDLALVLGITKVL